MSKDKLQQELRKPDELLSFFEKIVRTLQPYRRMILTLFVAGGVVVPLAVLALLWREKENMKTADALADVIHVYPAESAKKEDWQKMISQLRLVAQDHKYSPLAKIGGLYEARASLEMGQHEEALKKYRSLEGKLRKPFVYLATEGMGFSLMELKKWNDAEKVWSELSKAKDNPYQDAHLWYLGLVQEAQNRIPQAIETYQEFEKTFPSSAHLEKVRMRMVMLRKPPSLQ